MVVLITGLPHSAVGLCTHPFSLLHYCPMSYTGNITDLQPQNQVLAVAMLTDPPCILVLIRTTLDF